MEIFLLCTELIDYTEWAIRKVRPTLNLYDYISGCLFFFPTVEECYNRDVFVWILIRSRLFFQGLRRPEYQHF